MIDTMDAKLLAAVADLKKRERIIPKAIIPSVDEMTVTANKRGFIEYFP